MTSTSSDFFPPFSLAMRKAGCLRWCAVALATFLIAGCGQEPTAAAAPAEAQLQAQVQLPRRAVIRPGGRARSPGSFALPEKVESKLPIYEIKMSPDDLARMDSDPRGETLYPATFAAYGVVYDNVRIRYRGQWARTWPKKPLKIFFNKDKPFQGQRRLNLNSSFRDPAFIRESLAYHIYRVSGSPA